MKILPFKHYKDEVTFLLLPNMNLLPFVAFYCSLVTAIIPDHTLGVHDTFDYSGFTYQGNRGNLLSNPGAMNSNPTTLASVALLLSVLFGL